LQIHSISSEETLFQEILSYQNQTLDMMHNIAEDDQVAYREFERTEIIRIQVVSHPIDLSWSEASN
jgi:hypothetical protein